MCAYPIEILNSVLICNLISQCHLAVHTLSHLWLVCHDCKLCTLSTELFRQLLVITVVAY